MDTVQPLAALLPRKLNDSGTTSPLATNVPAWRWALAHVLAQAFSEFRHGGQGAGPDNVPAAPRGFQDNRQAASPGTQRLAAKHQPGTGGSRCGRFAKGADSHSISFPGLETGTGPW